MFGIPTFLEYPFQYRSAPPPPKSVGLWRIETRRSVWGIGFLHFPSIAQVIGFHHLRLMISCLMECPCSSVN